MDLLSFAAVILSAALGAKSGERQPLNHRWLLQVSRICSSVVRKYNVLQLWHEAPAHLKIQLGTVTYIYIYIILQEPRAWIWPGQAPLFAQYAMHNVGSGGRETR